MSAASCDRTRSRRPGGSTRIFEVQWESDLSRDVAEHSSSALRLIEPRSDQKVERPRMWRVLLHNDDYTTQEFVVWVLESVFRKPRTEAVEVMMRVHLSGIGVAGIYTHDVAETKLRKTRQMAEEQEFPLLVTMEPEPGPEHE